MLRVKSRSSARSELDQLAWPLDSAFSSPSGPPDSSASCSAPSVFSTLPPTSPAASVGRDSSD
eukprot:5477106-Pleurochrysis_carterae.AAC.1